MTSPVTEQLVEVPMPKLGTSITEGELIAWLKQPGDPVAVDEGLCEISTDKVDSEVPSPVAGVLTEILVQPGEVVDVGTVLGRIGVEGTASSPPEPSTRRFYSPLARRLAADHGIDLDTISGSGSNGRVTKRDVEMAIGGDRGEPKLHSDSPYRRDPPLTAAAAAADDIDDLGGRIEPLPRMRLAIGAAMRRSQETAATCHTVIECDFSGVERRRRELAVTALPIVARAVIESLTEFPDLNATLGESDITRFERVHLGIAVSLGDDGLIVPVVRDAQNLSVEGLSARIKEVAARARAGEMSPDEVGGATFTITNPGAYGATIATPIIDVPQVAILDLEAIVRRPVVVIAEDGSESIAIRSMVNLVLGWDHRAIDGVYAARFLAAVRSALN